MPSDPFPYRNGKAWGAAALTEMPSVSPVDGTVVGWFPITPPEVVPRMAERLRAEAPEWAALPLRERLARLACLKQGLAARAEALVEMLAREIGRPPVEGYGGEVLPTLKYLHWLERNAARVLRPVLLSRWPRRVQEWAPYGVVGLITPWNYPLFLSLPQIAQALAAGNPVLWKPSELALGTSTLIRELLEEAGLGEVVRMAGGDAAVGRAVTAAACDKYVVIGSAETGRAVLERLGRDLRPAVAELSGVDPLVVLADAPVKPAARAAVWGRVMGAGQTCMSPKRIFVHQAVYEAFLAEAEAVLRGLRVGDPRQAGVEVGPLRTEALRAAALEAVREAVQHGARLVCGGTALPGAGWFLEPTLLADCTDEMRVFREDLFAPVLAVSPVANAEEAVRRANASPYALTASVWTGNRRNGAAVARRLPGGVVSVNEVLLPGAAADGPFGGGGESGYGRTRGAEGLREMVRPRLVEEAPPGWRPRVHYYPYRAGTAEVLKAAAQLAGSAGAARWKAAGAMWKALRGFGKGSEE